jgi:cation diffusion facilitator family transporter
MHRSELTKFAWLSVAASLVTIGLKALAYWLTGSVGLLSDAVESTVNLAAALLTLIVLALAARPPDEDHAYGHDKAEYFASGAEGMLILVAAATIAVPAVGRLFDPQPVDQIGLGLLASLAASAINFVVGRVLLRAGRRHRSIALEADGHHLMTDVWTSAGVGLGLIVVYATGWLRLDALIALLVAAHIVYAGWQLMQRSLLGLLDTGLPLAERELIAAVLERYAARGVNYHALRTRQAGARRFVEVHILVPGRWTVQRGHKLLEAIERDLRQALPGVSVLTHLEPIEDPDSFRDQLLDRAETMPAAVDTASYPH